MDFYGQTSATVATVPTGRSPTWFEAVNSEFFYEQNQIQDMKSKNHHNIYSTNITNHLSNVHDQPLTMVTTSEQQTHTGIDYYQQPNVHSMHFNSNANYLPQTHSQSQSQSPQQPYNGDGNAMVSYAPCQGPRPWNFAQCYGFYGQPACSLLNIIDMEDFMWVFFSKCIRKTLKMPLKLSVATAQRLSACTNKINRLEVRTCTLVIVLVLFWFDSIWLRLVWSEDSNIRVKPTH